MLLLSLFGLFSIAQSKDCYCGDGNSYWQTSSNNCYSGFTNTKVYNIRGSWEEACRKCSKKAVEHMKNDGVTGKCFVCEKSITGMYIRVPPGKWDTAMHMNRASEKWIDGSVNCRGTSMSNYGRSVSRYIMGSRDFGGDIYMSRRQRQLGAQRYGRQVDMASCLALAGAQITSPEMQACMDMICEAEPCEEYPDCQPVFMYYNFCDSATRHKSA